MKYASCLARVHFLSYLFVCPGRRGEGRFLHLTYMSKITLTFGIVASTSSIW